MEKILHNQLINGKFENVSITRSKMMRAVKGRENKTTDLNFRHALKKAGISGWESNAMLVGHPDIIFKNYNVVVFLDGCFWHGCPECGHIPKTNFGFWKKKLERNKERDEKNTKILCDMGYLVIRFWEHELSKEIDACVASVIDGIEKQLCKISMNIDMFPGP